MPALTIETARREANINARAARLFTTEGYKFSPLMPGQTVAESTQFIVLPADKEKTGYIVDLTNATCNCRGFAMHSVCSHLIAIEQAAYDADLARRAADYDAAMLEYDPHPKF